MIVTYIDKSTGSYQTIFNASCLDKAISRIWTDSEVEKEFLLLRRNRICRVKLTDICPIYTHFDSYLIYEDIMQPTNKEKRNVSQRSFSFP